MKDKHRSWLRKGAWAVAIALVAFELVYVVAANTILRTRSLDRWVTGATEGLFLKVESGWTVWPGRVYVKGVELHFEDYNVQFSLQIDEATVDIALWQLPAKIFHLTRVRAQGVHYLFRHKVTSPAGHERRLALYPRIPGYSDPPLFVGPPTPPLTDEQYNLWTIHLEDVDAAATELWFLEYRFTGKARARGGFRLVPERDAQTELCTLSLDGTLQAGKQTVAASKLKGWLHAQLDRHDPRVVLGAQIFKKISVNTKLHADLPGLEVAELYRDPGDPTLRRGAGSVDARVQLEHGAWMENTAIRYETDSIRLARAPWSVAGPLVLVAAIPERGSDSLLELTASSSRLHLSDADSPEGIEEPEARAVRLSLGTTANLTRPIEMRSARTRFELEAPELRWLNHVVEEDQLFTHGSARADVDLRWSKGHRGGGTVALAAKEARFALADNVIQISGTAEALLTYDGGAQRGRADRLKARLPLVAVLHDGDWKALPGGLSAQAEHLTWQGEPPRRVQGRFSLDAKEVDAFVPFVISSSLLRAIVKALVDLGETHAVVELDRDPSALELRVVEAHSGDLRVFGTLRSEQGQKDPCGRFYIDDPKFGVGVVLYGGETSVKPFVSADWWRSSPAVTSCGPGFAHKNAPKPQTANEADREAKRLAKR